MLRARELLAARGDGSSEALRHLVTEVRHRVRKHITLKRIERSCWTTSYWWCGRYLGQRGDSCKTAARTRSAVVDGLERMVVRHILHGSVTSPSRIRRIRLAGLEWW
jgi:hypothetical protein